MTRLSRTDGLEASGLGVVIALILSAVSMAARQAGLAVGPRLIAGALVPHLIYAALLRAGARLVFGRGIRHQPA